jgi:cell shape-determining protein MreC
MTTFEPRNRRIRLSCRVAALLAGLVSAVGLTCLPMQWCGTMKGYVGALLRPGQRAVLRLRQLGGRVAAHVESHFATAARLAEIEQHRKRLAEENRRLAAELIALRSRAAATRLDSEDDEAERLFAVRCVRATVLGQQARAFLGRHHLLDAGCRAGVRPDAVVIGARLGLIDRGADAGLNRGQLVLSGRRVWGKIVEVGPYTSTVCTVTEPGYRDLVRVGRSGPQGILEGTGQPLARVRLVAATEPVAVGDPVLRAADQGILPEPLLYGSVVRLERPVGAAHWEIWIEPAMDPEAADDVSVLEIGLNPLRTEGGAR